MLLLSLLGLWKLQAVGYFQQKVSMGKNLARNRTATNWGANKLLMGGGPMFWKLLSSDLST